MANVQGLVFEISANASKLKKSISESRRALDDAQQSADDFQKSLDDVTGGADTAAGATDKFGNKTKTATGSVSTFVTKLKSQVSVMGTLKTSINGVTTALGVVAKTAGVAGAAFAGLYGAVALRANAAKEVQNFSNMLGMNVVDLQKWQFAAGKVGIEGDKVADIFKDISDKVNDYVTTGGGAAADHFEALGLKVKDFIGLAPDQAMLKLGQAMEGLTQGQKIFFMEAIASDASMLIPLLDKNAEGFKKLAAEAEKTGNVLSQGQVNAAAGFARAIGEIYDRVRGFWAQLSAELAPAFLVIADYVKDWADSFGSVRDMAKSAVAFILGGIKSVIGGVSDLIKGVGSISTSFVELKIRILEAERAWHNFWQSIKPSEIARSLGVNMDIDTSRGAIAIRNIDRELTDLYSKVNDAPKFGFDGDAIGANIDQLIADMQTAIDAGTDDFGDATGDLVNPLNRNVSATKDLTNSVKTISDDIAAKLGIANSNPTASTGGKSGEGIKISESVSKLNYGFTRYVDAAKKAALSGDSKHLAYVIGRMEDQIKGTAKGGQTDLAAGMLETLKSVKEMAANTTLSDALTTQVGAIDQQTQALATNSGTQTGLTNVITNQITANNQQTTALNNQMQAINTLVTTLNKPLPKLGSIDINVLTSGKQMSVTLQGTAEHIKFLKNFIAKNTNNAARTQDA